MSTGLTIETTPPSSPEGAAARASMAQEVSGIIGEHWALAVDDDPDLVAPDGAFWVARRTAGGEVLGCIGVRTLTGGEVEVKRLWVSPSSRGTGTGASLLATAEQWARDRGALRMVLDTRSELDAAARLYRRSGWSQVEAYNDNPQAQLWFAKTLG